MAEYWKSTPTYWCKFCTIYIKDTPLEKKNHEASGKHQNNIQRSLRDLHRKNDREEREKQRAKAEVERVNGIVGGKSRSASGGVKIEGVKDLGGSSKVVAAAGGKVLSAAQQRKVHAEQLAALGVELPEELKREVTGVGGWQVVSERVVEDERPAAHVVKEEREGGVKGEEDSGVIRGVRKRRFGDGEGGDGEEAVEERARKKAWGSRVKMYPGAGTGEEAGEEDLDVLLSGVTSKKPKVEQQDEEVVEDGDKTEKVPAKQEATSVSAPESDAADVEPVKQETGADKINAPPVVFFKKRKAKR